MATLTHTRTRTHAVTVPANPYLRCSACGGRVEFWRAYDDGGHAHNQPCGHRADYDNVCPSWGPVDGCQCQAHLGHVPHPPAPAATTSRRDPGALMAEFKFGNQNVPDGTHCCGKPAGCTNESKECVYRGTPAKPAQGATAIPWSLSAKFLPEEWATLLAAEPRPSETYTPGGELLYSLFRQLNDAHGRMLASPANGG